MDDHERIIGVSEAIAAAIARRDLALLRKFLAPGFVQRPHGGEGVDAEGFLRAIGEFPHAIEFVRLENVVVDLAGVGALVTGVQHAKVRVEGREVEERRGFIDWFVTIDGEWRIQAAVDFPVAAEQG